MKFTQIPTSSARLPEFFDNPVLLGCWWYRTKRRRAPRKASEWPAFVKQVQQALDSLP